MAKNFLLSHPAAVSIACPLNAELAVLDQLLAALAAPGEETGLDLALDLRWELMQRVEAESVLAIFFRLQAVVGDRHYLACYRLRRALETTLRAAVRCNRREPAQIVTLRLDVAHIPALRRRIASIFSNQEATLTHVTFRFRDLPVLSGN